MPTSRPRHLITESDHIAAAIHDAATRWPQDQGSPTKLIVHLIEEGHNALLARDEERRRARLAAVHRTSGSLVGAYGADYLDELRQEWPA